MFRLTASIGILSTILVASASSAPPKTKPAAPMHDAAVEAQLKAIFTRTDINKDMFLDATEVARSYRGYGAKPAPQPGYDSKGNYVAESATNGYKYPDQIFMLAADRDGDNRVSWDEFDVYGESIAVKVKSQQQAMKAAYARAQRNQASQRNRAYSRNGRGHHRPVARHARRR